MTDLRATALEARAAGISFLPAAPDGTKRPFPNGRGAWKEWQGRLPTEAELRRWFPPASGGGFVTGAVSGGLEMFEFEGRAVDDGLLEEFDAAAEAAGCWELVKRLVDGYCERTPSGGIHLFYRCTEIGGPVKLAQRPATADELAAKPDDKLRELIETKGEGGFGIVAGSNGTTHPTGRAWELTSGGIGTIPTLTPDERRLLFDLARSFDRTPRNPQPAVHPRSDPSERWEIRPGDDYNERVTWPAILEPHGWVKLYTTSAGNEHWRRPGKAAGVSATISDHGTGGLYVFTSSTPFDPGRAYSRFSATVTLDHEGDVTRAVHDLETAGYGRRVDEQTPVHQRGSSDGQDDGCRTITLTAASTIRIRPVRWLWDDRLALGTLALLGGREGVGKSTAGYQLTADITAGRLPGVHHGQAKAVIVAATEDSWEHTIVPRLIAAGADLERVYRIDVTTAAGYTGSLTLPADLGALQHQIAEVDAAMLLLDPLMSRLDAKLDTHKDAEVRQALEPLVALADRAGVTVVGLIHVNKAISSDPLTMLMASRAFAAVARAVLFVTVDPDNETVRILGQPKNNLGRVDLPSLTFTIESAMVADTDEGPVWTGRLRWGDSDNRSISEVLRSAAESADARSATDEAAGWLADYLQIHDVASSQVVKAAGKEAGHGVDGLKRARQRIGAGAISDGFPRRTYWSKPGMTPDQALHHLENGTERNA